MKIIALLFFISSTFIFAQSAPKHWWQVAPASQRQGSWEILPHEAGPGELILSKRNELGVFSNLGHAPFALDGIRYASVEALWQALKYPDPLLRNDARNKLNYNHRRSYLYDKHGFESKRLGDAANKIMKRHGINYVSYQGHKFNYKDKRSGSDYHYRLIRKAIRAKVLQNPALKKLLLSTKGYTLMPDHQIKATSPRSYFYHKILMELRAEL